MSYAEALRDGGTADALEGVRRRGDGLVATSGGAAIYEGRLSKLAVRDESGDDARLLQAKAALRNACASKPGDVSRSKALSAAVAGAVPTGRARDAPLAPILERPEERRGDGPLVAPRRGLGRHAQDALADDVAQRRAAAETPSSKQEQTMRALRLNTPAKRGLRGRRGRGRRP